MQSELIGKVLRIGCALPSGTRFLQIIPIKMKRAISVRKAALVVATVRNTSLTERRFTTLGAEGSLSLSRDKSGISCVQDRNLVLVVDDDSGILEGLDRLLRARAYVPILFSSAEAFNNHTDFDSAVCVILDINLNDGSGIELRHRLRADGIPCRLFT